MRKRIQPFIFYALIFSTILMFCTVSPTIARPDTQTGSQTPTPAATAPMLTATPSAATATRISEKDHADEIFIPAGEFIMGSTDTDAKQSMAGGVAFPEVPAQTVYLDGYWIDKYEVTNARYALCVADGGCKAPWHNLSYTGGITYYGNPAYDNYPVIYIDWFMADAYCKWAGRRLPTESEWEKAARGTDGRRYPWGNDPITNDKANFCDINCPKAHNNINYDDGYPEIAPVGSYPAGASPYGVMDMAGNVWEWTSTYPKVYPLDSDNPELTYERIWRGGPWSNGSWWIRSSIRYRSVPKYWYNNLGFRCAATD